MAQRKAVKYEAAAGMAKCNHRHNTKVLARKCAAKMKASMGGTWRVRQAR